MNHQERMANYEIHTELVIDSFNSAMIEFQTRFVKKNGAMEAASMATALILYVAALVAKFPDENRKEVGEALIRHFESHVKKSIDNPTARPGQAGQG